VKAHLALGIWVALLDKLQNHVVLILDTNILSISPAHSRGAHVLLLQHPTLLQDLSPNLRRKIPCQLHGSLMTAISMHESNRNSNAAFPCPDPVLCSG
jgi:hypothetical protein